MRVEYEIVLEVDDVGTSVADLQASVTAKVSSNGGAQSSTFATNLGTA